MEASLDALIRESLRLEPDAIGGERLERLWRVESRRQARRQLARRAVPLAAAAMLACLFFFASRKEPVDDVANTGKTPKPSIRQSSAPDHVTVPGPIAIDSVAIDGLASAERTISEPVVSTDNLSAGRPPTTYERILFVAATRIQKPPPPLPPASPSAALVREVTVARLTGELAAYEQVAGGIQRWRELVRKTPDAEVRYALMQRLLTAKSQPSLVAYLSLVRDRALRDEALAAGAELKELPVDGFIELLGHEDESVRLAAAVVLGRMNRCEMTAALIDRVQQQPSNSQEAWFALFACRCDAADTFLVHATQSPQLLGQFNHAQLQWAQLSY